MFKLGLDVGSSTVKLAVIEDNELRKTIMVKHFGKISKAISGLLKEAGVDKAFVCMTGQKARGLENKVDFREEIPCLVDGLKFLGINKGSIIEIGAQSSKFVTGINSKAPEFFSNEHCAGGTGSFFEDQTSRLGLNIEDYSEIVSKAKSIPRLSGRCSVFAKTDIIHRQQEGVEIADILKGLCYAMVRNFKATIVRNANVETPIYLAGGVSLNLGLREAVVDLFNIDKNDLIIHEHCRHFASIGAALKASKELVISDLIKQIDNLDLNIYAHSLDKLPDSSDIYLEDPKTVAMPKDAKPYLGIDIGSTSTDLVLMGANGELYDYLYLRTKGDSKAAVKKGLDIFNKHYGKLNYSAVGVTGSGRERIGKLIGADSIKDEITAQAKTASYLFPDADTVFEIGGQDSKFISLNKGQVKDFQMNKICAAGTGSFVEEQAARLNIPIDKYGELAMTAKHPIDLGERCTVFIETSISTALSDGASKEDVAAGLCYSIIKNYLHKVVASKNVGENIVLQGGVCYNPAIVAAFKSVYKDRVNVSPYFSISGAFGVARLAMEEMNEAKNKKSQFHGFIQEDLIVKEELSEEIKKNIDFFNKPKEIFFSNYDKTINPKKKTVGIPYVLLMHKFFPLANAFFRGLGYNVVLSDATNEDIILKSQEKAQGETCYPVKLMYGHFQQLIEKGVDYIFMPRVHTLKHESSSLEHNYACAYMQSAPEMIGKSLKLEEKGITLLSPVFDLDFGKKAMVSSMVGLGKILHKPKPFCVKALMNGAAIVRKHDAYIEAMGKEYLANIKPEEKVLVIITRNYGISDSVLNMGIPELLLKRGYKVITLSHLPAHDLDIKADHPNMYWPFGQHIISGAKIVAKNPNLFAVYLTNHGCGPDTMLSHLFKQEMGDKPYLQIEVDEHFSKVGVITRIEAFLNSLNSIKLDKNNTIKNLTNDLLTIKTQIVSNIDKSQPVYIANLGEYSKTLAMSLRNQGYKAQSLEAPDIDCLDLGQSVTDSKEYVTFTALAQQLLETDCPGTYIIPSSKGAEADGQFPYVLSSILRNRQELDKKIYTPEIENIPQIVNDLDQFVRNLVWTDLYVNNAKTVLEGKTPSWARLGQIAKTIALSDAKEIGILGDPYMIASLGRKQIEEIKKDFRVIQASVAEYFLYLWLLENPKDERLIEIKRHLNELRSLVYSTAIFSDLDDLENISKNEIGVINAGNISYRYAKAIDMSRKCAGVIQFSPRYENVSMIMEIFKLRDKCASPYYLLNLDGDYDEASKRKLNSFLYYCR